MIRLLTIVLCILHEINGRVPFKYNGLRDNLQHLNNTAKSNISLKLNTSIEIRAYNSSFIKNENETTNFSNEDKCPQCEKKEYHRKMIEKHILDSLRLSKPPNLTRLAIPDRLLLDDLLKDIDSYSHAEDSYYNRDRLENNELVDKAGIYPSLKGPYPYVFARGIKRSSVSFFAFSNLERVSFKLSLHIKRKDIKDTSNLIYKIYILHLQNGIVGRTEIASVPLNEREKIKIQEKIEFWTQISMKASLPPIEPGTVGLQAEVWNNKTNDILDIIYGSEEKDIFAPNIQIEDPENKRKKRWSDDFCDYEDKLEKRQCCKYPLELDFRDMQWHYILAPDKFEASYCEGHCPTYVMLNHEDGRRSRRYDTTCCHPKEFGHVSFIYVSETGSIRKDVIKDARALRCGCG